MLLSDVIAVITAISEAEDYYVPVYGRTTKRRSVALRDSMSDCLLSKMFYCSCNHIILSLHDFQLATVYPFTGIMTSNSICGETKL